MDMKYTLESGPSRLFFNCRIFLGATGLLFLFSKIQIQFTKFSVKQIEDTMLVMF